MIKFLEELKGLFLVIAAIAGIGVSLYGIMYYGRFTTICVALIALAITITLRLIIHRMRKKRYGESPMILTYPLELKYGTLCLFSECKAGLFLYDGTLCFKNEDDDAFIISTGTRFFGGAHTKEEMGALRIIPLVRR